MARDPPNPSPALLDVSPHLRDLSLTPSAVKQANPVIIHPQLRDLILPLERGRVLYPRGNAIEELTWDAKDGDRDRDRGEDEDGDEEMSSDEAGRGDGIHQTRKTFVKLNFTPNCLIANKTMLAAGGQHGELYITNAPLRTGINATSIEDKLAARFPTRPLRPFTINLNLQNRSINNSMILLPTYPNDWIRYSDERRIGNKAFRRGDQYTHPHSNSGAGYGSDSGSRVDPEDLNQDEREMDMDGIEEMDDEAMDLDEDDEDEDEDDDNDETDEEEPRSPLTYPNTVPFLHAPRIPQLPNRQSSDWMTSASSGPSRRAASFSDRFDPRYAGGAVGSGGLQRSGGRLERQSFSIPRPGTGLPPIEYVTSRPIPNLATRSPAGRSEGSAAASASGSRKRETQRHNALKCRDSRMASHVDEPRLLISNNDLSVKMFALRSVPASSGTTATNEMLNTGLAHYRNQRSSRRGGTLGSGTSAHLPTSIGRPGGPSRITDPTLADWIGMTDTRPQSERLRERLDIQRREFQRITGMPVTGSAMGNPRTGSGIPPAPSPLPLQGHQQEEERKLVRIGGSKFKCAINHSSLSPDLKNMVSVGDSEEVYLFEVVDGGREFRKVATYKGASDSGFSTAWSRDGRKFAVASQDGQVTVWDHRSSNPLAKFYSSRAPSPHSHSDPPSFSSDLHLSRYQDIRRSAPLLVDPVTGIARMGMSSSGREAARVVKFSPEGAPRDLLVFSEENTNIHIIDAQTLNEHVIIPVPSDPSESESDPSSEPTGNQNQRAGIQGGQWGISGIAFDPTGQWLYSGTERTVVEWDMRAEGGMGRRGGGGVWDPR